MAVRASVSQRIDKHFKKRSLRCRPLKISGHTVVQNNVQNNPQPRRTEMLEPSSVRGMLCGRQLCNHDRGQRISSILLVFVERAVSFGEQFLRLNASPVLCPSNREVNWHLLAFQVH